MQASFGAEKPAVDTRPARLWMPERVIATPDARREPFGQRMVERLTSLGLDVEELKSNRLTNLRGTDERETYRIAKFDRVDGLLDLPHGGRTRARLSLNAEPIVRRLEGGTASVEARIKALRQLALAEYPVGVVLAPLMPIPDWQRHHTELIDRLVVALNFPCDLTAEFITHRFTPGSKQVLLDGYPNTSLDMNEATRAAKRNKFGGVKYVFTPADTTILRQFLQRSWQERFPRATTLYWT